MTDRQETRPERQETRPERQEPYTQPDCDATAWSGSVCTSWPDCSHTPRCARCTVLDVCRAQLLAMPHAGRIMASGYDVSGATGEQMPGPTFRAKLDITKLAAQVADRLLAWLRWPGALMFCFPPPRGWSRCTPAEARELRARGLEVFVAHPLDAYERGKQVRGPAWCWRCLGTGVYVNPFTGHGAQRTLTCEPHPGPDWEYTAIAADIITERGMWGDVHVWRP